MPKSPEFRRLLRGCAAGFAAAGAFSLAINLLYLAGPLYMLQVYDRVVPSGSEVTLLMLTVALLLAYLVLAGLDMVRATILTRLSIRIDRQMAPRVMQAIIAGPVAGGEARGQILREFDTFRQFASGGGIHAIFDLPWAPIYVATIFILHWVLGIFAVVCCLALLAMALLNELLIRKPLAEANAAAARSYGFTEAAVRNGEIVRAMGMTAGLLHRWARDRAVMLSRQAGASDRGAAVQAVIRFLRLGMQSAVLGLGAYLVIEHDASSGAMFAASLLLGRALQPIEQVVGGWRNQTAARRAMRRLDELFLARPVAERALTLPRPAGRLEVENLTCVVPGQPAPLLRGVSFALAAGEVLGVIGPSGAGKSTLARHLVGVVAASAGSVRLDGADVVAWSRSTLGQHVGYLPQDIELFSGTVGANINRFETDNDGATLRAAQRARVHDLVLRLGDGYETLVGEGGVALSGGTRQRIGLARAVYGAPSLVVLDEPSSNLDASGDSALADCVHDLKNDGTTTVVISHRLSTLGVVDKLLLLRDGQALMFGPRAEVLAKLSQQQAAEGGPGVQPVRRIRSGG
ncbi:MAG: type I secretion system permease/ATPase [Reyranellales bacterium]